MVKELARQHGYFASFMPKPYSNQTGSGAHYNMSLADIKTGENLFLSHDDPRGCKLSTLGYQFIAGILKHAPALCAVIAPTVNSYKRLVAQGSMSGFTWAPVYICYGNNNRTNMLRIPLAGGRVECRAADISTNLYLGAAMILTAGLEGIREGLDPGEPHTENMYKYTAKERVAKGIQSLPRTLGDAIEAFAADLLGETVMGSLMFQTFIDFKTQEWLEYHNHISDWERQRYLKFFNVSSLKAAHPLCLPLALHSRSGDSMGTPSSLDLQELKLALKEKGVKYAIASFVDIHGMCKAKMVPLTHFEQMMQGSELFTGAALDGVPQEINDEEVATMPDPASATVLPWNSEIAWFASDLYVGGKPFEACCRSILKNALKQAADMGFQFNLGVETSFSS